MAAKLLPLSGAMITTTATVTIIIAIITILIFTFTEIFNETVREFPHSNDDIALRQLLFGDGTCRTGGRDAKVTASVSKGRAARLKLSSAEVAVLCWERGLLRSRHCSGGKVRWGVVGDQAPAAQAQAMFRM